MAFLKHLNVADASCRSCHGNKWPHDSMDPGRLPRQERAGVGAGGLSPNSSLAGSFIFLVASTACPRASRPRADGAVLVSASVARPLSRGLAFFAAGVALVAKA